MSDAALKPVDILLVEDDPSDIQMTRLALSESKIRNKLFVIEDGESALAYLFKRPPYADVTTPDLILLDLNLPNLDGTEVLARIKEDELLRQIPVVVLTTSNAKEDIMKSYDLHANCYIKKPLDLDQFIKVVQEVQEFWFTIVLHPKR